MNNNTSKSMSTVHYFLLIFTGLFGRRCKSTPGIIESHDKIPLEDMWISPYTDNLTNLRNINLEALYHPLPTSISKTAPSYK